MEWERCFSGAPRRSTCPSYLMKRPLPMNLVNGSRLVPWQRNASLPGLPLPQPPPIRFLVFTEPGDVVMRGCIVLVGVESDSLR